MSINERLLDWIREGLNIDRERKKYILDFTNRLIKEYEYDPIDAINDISFKFSGKERYLSSYIFGVSYEYLYKKMTYNEYRYFFIEIANELGIPEEREKELFDYFIEKWRILITKAGKGEAMKSDEIIEIVKNMSDANFSDIEKIYTFFLFGSVLH